MKKVFVLIAAIALSSPALAQKTVDQLGAGSAVSGTDILPAYQGANPATGVTASQLKTFMGGGTVTSVATACGVSGGPITTTGTIQATANPSTETGANYAFLAADMCTTVYLNNASNQIPTIPQANTTGFENGKFIEVCNIGAGTQTITPTTSTIGGASTYVLAAGSAAAPKCIGIIAQSGNYVLDQTGPNAVPPAGLYTTTGALKGNGSGTISQAACGDLSNGAAGCSASLGTGVGTALAANLSAAGGLTTTIASGTSAMGTGAISSATCASVVTTTATNTATTDVVLASFNGDPTAVTGYTPVTTGALTIFAYPTSGNVNFKVCNLTSGSITPGAITLNWRVVR
jgi:hypothetical protein